MAGRPRRWVGIAADRPSGRHAGHAGGLSPHPHPVGRACKGKGELDVGPGQGEGGAGLGGSIHTPPPATGRRAHGPTWLAALTKGLTPSFTSCPGSKTAQRMGQGPATPQRCAYTCVRAHVVCVCGRKGGGSARAACSLRVICSGTMPCCTVLQSDCCRDKHTRRLCKYNNGVNRRAARQSHGNLSVRPAFSVVDRRLFRLRSTVCLSVSRRGTSASTKKNATLAKTGYYY